MIAVCDMGPLHYLVLIEAEHILPRLFNDETHRMHPNFEAVEVA
jgi:hypothetical protein